MREMFTDKITVLHVDGSKHENVRASVQRKKIYSDDMNVPISENDVIERVLPNGKIETLLIEDVFVSPGFHSIPPTYEIEYKRATTQRRQSLTPTVNVRVSDSPQAHVNVQSSDRSTTINVEQNEELFAEIRRLLDQHVDDKNELKDLSNKIDEMERCLETSDFKKAYQEFIAAASEHLPFLAPLLPALSALL